MKLHRRCLMASAFQPDLSRLGEDEAERLERPSSQRFHSVANKRKSLLRAQRLNRDFMSIWKRGSPYFKMKTLVWGHSKHFMSTNKQSLITCLILDYLIIPSSSFSQISMTWLENSNMLCGFFWGLLFFFFFFHATKNALTFEGPEAPADPGGQVEDALDTKSNFKWLQRPCEHAWNRVIPLVLKIWWIAIETQTCYFYAANCLSHLCWGPRMANRTVLGDTITKTVHF